ncbi:CCR4-NOT transcription complex subunit 4-like isoform X1 [Argiope bruennichi]|uniref:CCR4-NOT transcription complex subunit 4-like isoform X1 n=1 Tax=Argiope bruennichi TaxID=94029 RepID=UPI002493E5FB|nr:CCR4-NOT transcription complex subunit 4-like isoform X1 [Argiope bruennichi]XP_055949561.1 CCR4-NOT transcription complex subunit 4-like isoform X1 [Argiope bruennichi]
MLFHDEQNLECPLCMEPFEMDDFTFFPCTCGYQICRFCWHRIRTDENGLCPACRKQYPEDPADFKPLSPEEWQKIKNEKRLKDQQKKQKLSECRKHLANVRVVQKNLVFVVGLPTRLADAEVLKKFDYFGKFGKIHKVVVNQSTSYAGSQGPSASAYVTYCKPEDALRAIKCVNNVQVDGRTLKASLGTTKYCSHFLKNQQCPKTDCMYLHELGDEAASFTKEDMQQGFIFRKHQEYEKKLQEQVLGNNNNRKQAASPTPPQTTTSSAKESWPCPVQNVKESRSNRTKDSTQSQRTEGKNNRSKNKHTSEGQKSKKSKNKTSESVQHHNSSKHSTKEDGSTTQKKSQKGKHKETTAAQPSGHSPLPSPSRELSISDVLEMNQKNAQTTYVCITEQQSQSKPVSASIKIARSESPVLPPSPLSSLSSSFTPFGSLSSNFLSSSSPSPPPSNSNPPSFGSLSGSSNANEETSPVNTFVSSQQIGEQKRQSPHPVFVSVENNDSLFSQLNYHTTSGDGSSYNGHIFNEEPCNTDSSDWSSTFSFEEPQKPEDDLDFDPWNESSKGLAAVIAEENSAINPNFSELPTPPGFFQPSKAPVPNQQRISVPPPGFCRQVPQTNTLSGMYDPSNLEFLQLKAPQTRQTMNGCSHYYLQDQLQNPMEVSNHYKQQQFPPTNSRDNNYMENLRLKKNFEDRVRNLIQSDAFYQYSRSVMKNQNQNGPTWNHQQGRDINWLANETMLNSGNLTEGQRTNTVWLKALQQLSIDENQIHGHSPYANPFALRGQWATAQCPPPGFVAPSRSPVNTPFQHMQVNQTNSVRNGNLLTNYGTGSDSHNWTAAQRFIRA